MPVRLVCPSCSATLSVKDEFAGRAVRCPKCGGVIPASQPGAPVPSPSRAVMPALPLPEPAPEPPPELFGVPEPAPPKGGKIVGRPVTPVPEGDEYDEEARPARRRGPRDERNGDDRPSTRRGAAGRDDDRPVRRRRPRDDGDDDRPEGKKGGKGPIIIVAILCGTLLTCCGGVGYGVYWAVNRVKEGVRAELNPKNDKVTFANYEKVKHGMTMSEVEAILGPGKIAAREKLIWMSDGAELGAPTGPLTQRRSETWNSKIDSGRVYYWQNEADAVFLLFHPNGNSFARVQMREFISKTGKSDWDTGIYRDDAAFVQKFGPANPLAGGLPPGPFGKPPMTAPVDDGVIEITSEELAREFRADEFAANAKYRGKTLVVSGRLNGPPSGDQMLRMFVNGIVGAVIKPGSENGVRAALPGQMVRFKGQCEMGFARNIVLSNCEVLEVVPANFVTVTADDLFADFTNDASEASKKYRGRGMNDYVYLHITNARVTKIGKNEVYLTGPTTKDANIQVRVGYLDAAAKPFAQIKVGDQVSVKGASGSGLLDVELVISWATIAP